MSDDRKSNDEIMSADRRWWRRWYVLSIVLAIAAIPLSLVWFNFISAHHPFLALGVTPQVEQQLEVTLFVIFIVALVYALRFFVGRPPAAQSEQIVRRTADSHYARMRWMYPLIALLMARYWFDPRGTFERDPLIFYIFVLALVTQTVTLLRGFYIGPLRRGLDDELTRTLRRKAAQFGYGLTVLLLAAGCIYTRYHSVPATALLLPILFAASVAPVLCFLFLEWQSGRNG